MPKQKMTFSVPKRYALLLLHGLLPLLCSAQIPDLDGYFLKRYTADSLMKAEAYSAAAAAYEACLAHPLHNRQDNYLLSIANIRNTDLTAARSNLVTAFEKGLRYPVEEGHTLDSNLFVFKSTDFWQEIDRMARENHAKYKAESDSTLYSLVIKLRDVLAGAPASYYFMPKDTVVPGVKEKLAAVQAQAIKDQLYVTGVLDSLYRIGKPLHLNVVGPKGYQWYRGMLFLLPTDWLNRRLPDLWQAVRTGDFRAEDYAPLEDQVAAGMNVPQRFATQLKPHPTKHTAVVYHPVRNAEVARKARVVCNLPSIEAQERRLAQKRGQEIWRSLENRSEF